MQWHHKPFGGAHFWRTADATGTVRARVHATPDGDFYWDVAIVDHGFVIIDQGRIHSLKAAQIAAASIAGRESRKRRSAARRQRA